MKRWKRISRGLNWENKTYTSLVSDDSVGVIPSSTYFQYDTLSFFWTRCLIIKTDKCEVNQEY